ncbi:Uncharacterised protein r2_g1909 [Pycnogonum litorale]
MKEYLSLLQSRNKWTAERTDFQKDDVVLLCDPSQPRGTWPLGRILRVMPGQDGRIRVAEVLSSGKTYVRPITKMTYLYSPQVSTDM